MSSEKRLAAVVLQRPLQQSFTYEVPPPLAADITPGVLVEVPFGPGRAIGCVVDLDPPDFIEGAFRLQPILRRVSPSYAIAPPLLDLARWMANYYFCSLGEALATVSMVGFADVEIGGRPGFRLVAGWDGAGLTTAQRRALDALRAAPPADPLPLADLGRQAGASTAILRRLVEAGALEEVPDALPPLGMPPPGPPPVLPELTVEQTTAVDTIGAAMDRFEVFLLHGVTGSGKTEVYLRLIRRAFEAGRSALCLVPEISLTPQTVERFSARFGEPVGVFHSQLSRREKLILHRHIERGTIRLVIGARSAAFAPLPNLGLVLVDEEHESSYKQGEVPRYHARDLVIYRASRLGIPVVLGSATPSMESYENATRGGKYRLLRLTHRPAGLQMPRVELVPMGAVAAADPGHHSLLSPRLAAAIRDRLDRGEQSLLFLNRRGFSNFLMCPHCNWVARCADDDIVLTIHRRRPRGAPRGEEGELELDLFPRPLQAPEAFLKCHFCGRTQDVPTRCPNCGEEGLAGMGTGTQRIEEALGRLYPGANILRLDQDAIGGRRAFLAAWQQMVSGQAQIILGTQMIAKGLHLERVTLVGVILADIGLFIPDFRAEERTFALLMQVAGRSGRTNMGEVLVQTYMPHHAAIRLAAEHDYEGFFAAERRRREKLQFPPIQRLIALTISDEDPARAERTIRQLRTLLADQIHRLDLRRIALLGPRPAPIERLAGRWRWRLLLRGEDWRANARLLRAALARPEWHPASATRLSIDVDPHDLL
jgi:primosomal protein N' (replication factor Y)